MPMETSKKWLNWWRVSGVYCIRYGCCKICAGELGQSIEIAPEW